MSGSIHIDRRATVTHVCIQREDKRNALTAAMMNTMAESIERTTTPVLVLTGAGMKSFCAGGDIGEFSTGSDALARQEKALLRLIMALARTPSLTMAAVHGRTLGAGGILAALVDVALMRDDASIGFPEIRFSMFPIIVYAVLLERISPALAWQLCGTGRMLDADECLQLGLASEILPGNDFARHVERAIGWYEERAPVFELMRPAVRVVDAERLQTRLRETTPLMLKNQALPGVAERIRAILRSAT